MNVVFLKYTNDICNNWKGEGRYTSYFLGALFVVSDIEFECLKNGLVNLLVLDNGADNFDDFGTHFNVQRDELTVVDNDKDYYRCVQLYRRIQSR